MAFTGSPTSATPYSLQVTAGISVYNTDLPLKAVPFSYTHGAGSGTGEVNLVKLPPGRLRIWSYLCRLVTTAFAANADLHLGYRAHTDLAGSAVNEDDNAFADNLDAGGGALAQAWPLPAVGYLDLDSLGGITIFALIDTGNIEDTDTINGAIVYSEREQ